jgi:hypothetical protein
MIFEHSAETRDWVERVQRFMDERIVPAVPTYESSMEKATRGKRSRSSRT